MTDSRWSKDEVPVPWGCWEGGCWELWTLKEPSVKMNALQQLLEDLGNQYFK